MKKIHLFKKQVLGFPSYECQCGVCIGEWEGEFIETTDYTKVTCLNCKKTKEYKRLKEQAEFKQETDKKMEEIKNEVFKQEKTCDNCGNDIHGEACKIDSPYLVDNQGNCTDWKQKKAGAKMSEYKEWDKSKKYKVGDKVLIDEILHEVVKNSDNDNNFCLNCINYSNHANCCTDCFKSIGESNRFKQVELQEPPKAGNHTFTREEINNHVSNDKQTTYKAKTYKAKIEIEIEVPVGYEFDEYRYAVKGESYINAYETFVKKCKAFESETMVYVVKKKVKQGSELIGMPVGVSDTSIKNAEEHANDFHNINIVHKYNSDHYVLESGDTYQFAYPVSPEQLDELKKQVQK